MKFQENVLLSEYTTFKVGGPAKFFYIAKNKEDLIEALKKAKEEKLKVFILGGGSNVLASSAGYDGLVIKLQNTKYKIQDTKVSVGSGMILGKLVKDVSEKSLSGLEWAVGIPGTVGGAICGNAQAFAGRISEAIKEVEYLDLNNLEVIKKASVKDCQFSNKESIFKKNKNLVILSAVLELKKGNQEEIEKKMKELIEKRVGRQPLDYPSAGSIFINHGNRSSSSLIDEAGLKGRAVGGAMVSSKHAGFIVNTGGASSDDILKLIEIIKKEVKKKFNVELETEIQVLK